MKELLVIILNIIVFLLIYMMVGNNFERKIEKPDREFCIVPESIKIRDEED